MPNPVAPKYDTITARFVAGIIDGFVLLPIGFLDEILRYFQMRWLTIVWLPIFYSSFWLYYVIAHRVYGKTVGKYVMKVSVVDVNDEGQISRKQAFLREGFYILMNTYSMVISLYALFYSVEENSTPIMIAAFVMLFGSFAWFMLEVISALTNDKRRAIHDLIAGTVVVKQEAVEE